jgi:hypothetical protein
MSMKRRRYRLGARAWPGAIAILVGVGCRAADIPSAVTIRDDGALRARASACLGLNGAQSVTLFWPPALAGGIDDGTAIRACVAEAADCPEISACVGYETEPCSADRCDSGVAIDCRTLDNGKVVAEAHACNAANSGNASCSVVDDVKEGTIAFCHADTCTDEHCEGETLVRCRSGLAIREDCAPAGRVCRELSETAFCALPEPCSADYCEGEIANLCHGGHVELRQRCSDLVPGSHCSASSGFVECRAAVEDPRCEEWGEFASWCDGASAWTCVGGSVFELNCGALAGGACHSEVIGVDGTEHRARCTSNEVEPTTGR